jgi:hypothetical protein
MSLPPPAPGPSARTAATKANDTAHDLLRERRAVWVRRAERALLTRALDAGTATADDVAAAVVALSATDRLNRKSGDVRQRGVDRNADTVIKYTA